MGWASRLNLPRPLRDPLYRGFSLAYGIDLASWIVHRWASLTASDDFFCRPLPDGAPARFRRASMRAHHPAMGAERVWRSHDGLCIHAKGAEYTVAGLLNDEVMAQRFTGGMFATIYLAPQLSTTASTAR